MSADTAKENKDALPDEKWVPIEKWMESRRLAPYSAEAQILAELRAIKSLLEQLIPKPIRSVHDCSFVTSDGKFCPNLVTHRVPSTGKGYCQLHHR